MNVKPIDSTNFGILKSTKKTVYAYNCWNTKTLGKYKDYDIKVFDNYINGKFSSTLICLNKAGKWVISKLKYIQKQKRKTLWSYANDRLV
jgi:hypothetical protein